MSYEYYKTENMTTSRESKTRKGSI